MISSCEVSVESLERVGVFHLQVWQVSGDGTGTFPLNGGRGWGAPHTYFASLNPRAKEHSGKLKRKKK